MVNQRLRSSIGKANQKSVPRADAEHQGKGEAGGRVPYGETQLRFHEDVGAIQ